MDVPECVWDLEAELGEGPVWDHRDDALWFVDIKQKRIHRWREDERRSWTAPAEPGFLAPRRAGGFVAGLKTGLHLFEPETERFQLVQTVEDPALGNRLNDGFVDRDGRLWFGSMHDAERETTGALYRLDGRGLAPCDAGYCITNGPAVSPDGRTLYHTDTLARRIYAFDLSPGGELSKRRVFVQLALSDGYPDGLTVDAAGYVWTGLYDGWSARRYAPDGRLDRIVPFPVANVTKLAFGGPDFDLVYATTAWKGLSAEARLRQPLAGGLFRFRAETPGLPASETPYV
jgi:sugar lactone lactonase YvrE